MLRIGLPSSSDVFVENDSRVRSYMSPTWITALFWEAEVEFTLSREQRTEEKSFFKEMTSCILISSLKVAGCSTGSVLLSAGFVWLTSYLSSPPLTASLLSGYVLFPLSVSLSFVEFLTSSSV